MQTRELIDVVVIGAGPAGMGVALNLLRAGRTVRLIERHAVGGQMATSPRVENIPGRISISGLELADQMFEQITSFGADFELEDVQRIEKDGDNFAVVTDYARHLCRTVILANGVTHRMMNLPNEQDLIGKGISFCAVCDGAFYKGKEVCLIGDGNTAVQYALLLSTYCSKVNMFLLFDYFRSDKILIDRLLKLPNVEIRKNMSLVEYIGEKELKGLKFQNTITKEETIYDTDNVFVAIGQVPHNDQFADIIKLENGFIVTNEQMETSTPGIFAVGDTRKKDVRQISTALGDASVCAVFCDKYISLH